jgi:hypothetical protein
MPLFQDFFIDQLFFGENVNAFAFLAHAHHLFELTLNHLLAVYMMNFVVLLLLLLERLLDFFLDLTIVLILLKLLKEIDLFVRLLVLLEVNLI